MTSKVERVWIVQRPTGTKGQWRNVAAYFKFGTAKTQCVPNFDDRIVEGTLRWNSCQKPKPAKSAKGKAVKHAKT